MKILLGCDHHGDELVNALVEHLEAGGHQVQTIGGATAGQPRDYPDQAYIVATAVASKVGSSMSWHMRRTASSPWGSTSMSAPQ